MEDPRLSRMYAKLLVQKMSHMRYNLYRSLKEHSGLIVIVGVIVLLLAVGIGVKERGRGNLHRLKAALKVDSVPEQQAADPTPGGQNPVVLQRLGMANASTPEFLSVTLLPGQGMNALQIRAYVPGKGDVDLLASPSLEDAAKLLNNPAGNAGGTAALGMGAAIEMPWAGHIWGPPGADGTGITTTWQGHSLYLPANSTMAGPTSNASSAGGLLMTQKADSMKSIVMPDGGQAQAMYQANDFNGHWLSSTQITITAQLSGRSIELDIAARNTGSEAEPIGIGWHPRFAILSGNRQQEILKLPGALHADNHKGMPSGKLSPVAGTSFDFSGRNGSRLGNLGLNDTFVHLTPGFMDSGPIAELRDPASNYGLRITALTPAIKAFHVDAPQDASFISIDPRYNYDDPFGHEWPKGEDTGMVVLQPGQMTQWKVRLEIFSLSAVTQHL